MAARMVLRTSSAPSLASYIEEDDFECEDLDEPPPPAEAPKKPLRPPSPERADIDDYGAPEPTPSPAPAPVAAIVEPVRPSPRPAPVEMKAKPPLIRAVSDGSVEVLDVAALKERIDEILSEKKGGEIKLGELKLGEKKFERPPLNKIQSSSALDSERSSGGSKGLPRSHVRKLNEVVAKASREEPVPIFQSIGEGKVLTVKQVQALNRLSLLTVSAPVLPLSRPGAPLEVKGQALNIQIASDLHIEMFHRNKLKSKVELYREVIKPVAPVLALLGDIGCPGTEEGFREYKQFLLCQAERFEKVLVLPGNHEYYSAGFGETPMTVKHIKRRIREFCESNPRLQFVDKSSLVLGGVRIAACTLWSHIPPSSKAAVEKGVNDYHLIYVEDEKGEGGSSPGDWFCSLAAESGGGPPIRPLRSDDSDEWHREELTFLKAEAIEAKRNRQNLLVLTHHTPTFVGTSNPMYKASPIRFAFSSDLEELFDYGGRSPYSALHTWASGHTHWSCDQMRNGVHVVSNQHGYTGTAECTYKPAFVLSIPSIPGPCPS